MTNNDFNTLPLHTITGLHGRLVEFRGGWALVYRPDAPLSYRPYSVHSLYALNDELASSSGLYDLTLAEAYDHLDRLTSGERERRTARDARDDNEREQS